MEAHYAFSVQMPGETVGTMDLTSAIRTLRPVVRPEQLAGLDQRATTTGRLTSPNAIEVDVTDRQ